jgi:hypothetical protein
VPYIGPSLIQMQKQIINLALFGPVNPLSQRFRPRLGLPANRSLQAQRM